MDKQKIF